MKGDAINLGELIARQTPGWSLEQPFYLSAELYAIECRGWLAKQWYVLGHSSELSLPGSYIVRELLQESLLLLRDKSGQLRGFYNVCRHRGSRLCTADGRTQRIVCPYHAWAYGLDGALETARALPTGVDPSRLSLHPVAVAEIGGVILASLGAEPSSLEEARRCFEPGLQYLELAGARIAARRQYPTRANWKLVMENFTECYHCPASHPEYCRVMQHVDQYGRDDPVKSAAWVREEARWLKADADSDSPLGAPDRDGVDARYWAGRSPIGNGRLSQSQDGCPVAPLLGGQKRFDGGVTAFVLRPFVYLLAANDYATLFQFLPTGPESTDVVISWLVNGKATDEAVDVDRMVWLWDVTTLQDKVIVEQNAQGVRSQDYTPGPYTTLESGSARLVADYLAGLGEN
jgi:Rieske 2Fe-2S family protein